MATNYTTTQGDTWDLISFKAFGSELYAAEIMKTNPAHINTAIFSAGVVLTLPVIAQETQAATNLPPWRRP